MWIPKFIRDRAVVDAKMEIIDHIDNYLEYALDDMQKTIAAALVKDLEPLFKDKE